MLKKLESQELLVLLLPPTKPHTELSHNLIFFFFFLQFLVLSPFTFFLVLSQSKKISFVPI